MKVSIDRDGCIGCGLCVETCPSVFRMGDDGLAEVYNQPNTGDEETCSQEAADNCPVGVITAE